jgi:hypothetical protein
MIRIVGTNQAWAGPHTLIRRDVSRCGALLPGASAASVGT